MKEQLYLVELLHSIKGLTNLFYTAMIESETREIREEFEKNLHIFSKHEFELLKILASKDICKYQNANPIIIDSVLEDINNLKGCCCHNNENHECKKGRQ